MPVTVRSSAEPRASTADASKYHANASLASFASGSPRSGGGGPGLEPYDWGGMDQRPGAFALAVHHDFMSAGAVG